MFNDNELAALPPETLGEFLRRMRNRTGLSQEAFVSKKGLPIEERTYQGYEAGNPVPTKHHQAFAEALGVPKALVRALADGEAVDPSGYAQGLLAAADEIEKKVVELRRMATIGGGAVLSTRKASARGKRRTPKKERKAR